MGINNNRLQWILDNCKDRDDTLKRLQTISIFTDNTIEDVADRVLLCLGGCNLEPIIECFEELSYKWEELAYRWSEISVYNDKNTDISSLKKRIKHCKNPMEKKMLERELNSAYKSRRIYGN